MAPVADQVRPKWFWPLIAFVAGLIVGWWVIGWVVWPVRWNNVLPQDLRAAERDHYLRMVAESYAANGDPELASQRLATWPDQQLTDDLDRLQARIGASDAQAAGQVQQLASALGVEQGSQAVPGDGPALAVPEGAAPATSGSILRTLLTAALWVILVLVGLAVILWLWNRWRSAKGKSTIGPLSGGFAAGARGRSAQSPLVGSSAPVATSPGAPTSDAGATPEDPLATPGLAQWQEVAPSAEISASGVDVPGNAPAGVTLPAGQPLPAAAALVAAAKAPAPPAKQAKPAVTSSDVNGRPSSPSPSVKAPVMAREFRAVYQMGEPDYDEAFDVADSSGAHLGQCGLELTEPVGKAHDQAAALQVWLWDTNDPDTKVRVLMSEGAYRDTALRAHLAAEHQAIPVRQGTEFELESYKLLLRGAVEKIDYADQDPPNGIFAEIRVRLQVYQKRS